MMEQKWISQILQLQKYIWIQICHNEYMPPKWLENSVSDNDPCHGTYPETTVSNYEILAYNWEFMIGDHTKRAILIRNQRVPHHH